MGTSSGSWQVRRAPYKGVINGKELNNESTYAKVLVLASANGTNNGDCSIVGASVNGINSGNYSIISGSSNINEADSSFITGVSNSATGGFTGRSFITGQVNKITGGGDGAIIASSSCEINIGGASASITGCVSVILNNWTATVASGIQSFTATVNGIDSSSKTFVGDLIIRNGAGLTAVPANSASTNGYVGQILFDDDNLYVRVDDGVDLWKRAALNAF